MFRATPRNSRRLGRTQSAAGRRQEQARQLAEVVAHIKQREAEHTAYMAQLEADNAEFAGYMAQVETWVAELEADPTGIKGHVA